MNLEKYPIVVIVAIALLCASCATTPEARKEAQNIAETKARTIEQILSEPLDAEDYGETERCLSQVRDIRVLDEQTLVFEGRHKKLWINQLPMRCPGLRRGSILQIRATSGFQRICKMDTFVASDWFEWPWYRQWPWRWGTGVKCSLGDFQPVTKLQVNAIQALQRQ